MSQIYELPSKDGNITSEKVRKSRQMEFRDKTAYVWVVCPMSRRLHFLLPWSRFSLIRLKFHIVCQVLDLLPGRSNSCGAAQLGGMRCMINETQKTQQEFYE